MVVNLILSSKDAFVNNRRPNDPAACFDVILPLGDFEDVGLGSIAVLTLDV